jgi:HD-GYP domain-containing protein (c-di-GMP phosphodiesterase class II)
MTKQDDRALERRVDELEAENTRLALRVADLEGRLEDEDEAIAVRDRELRLSYIGTIQAISRAIEAKDPYTQGHSALVTKHAMALARELGTPWSEIERIQIAAMLLDVGKIGVPGEILVKTTPLTAEEFAVLRTHVAIGAKILEPVVYPWEVSSLVYQHHERIDGSGYPRGLVGEDIVPEARLLGLVDSFCAMITDRAYRGAFTHADTIAFLRDNAGKLFDPAMVAAFERLLARGEDEIFRDLDEFAGKTR